MTTRRPPVPKDQLLSMIRSVAEELKLDRLPQGTFLKAAGLSRWAVDQHFDTWTDACRAAGIGRGRTLAEMPRSERQTKDDCVAEMRRVAALRGTGTLSSRVYGNYGRISVKAITRRFGDWRQALLAAGLGPTPASERQRLPSRDQCVSELQRVASSLGSDHLTSAEFDRHAQLSSYRITRVFGSWHGALKEAGLKPSPHFIREIPLSDLATDFLNASIELGRVPTINQLARRSKHVSHTFAGKHGGYSAFKRHAIEHLISVGARIPPAILESFQSEQVLSSSAGAPAPLEVPKVARDELVANGLLSAIRTSLIAWNPPSLGRELLYSNALAAHLRITLPADAQVEREYRHEGTTCDIRIAYDQDEVFVEVKWQLQRKADYDRLVGQVEGLKPRKNKVMVVLIGDTNEQLLGRLRAQFRGYLAGQQVGEEKFMIELLPGRS